MRYEIEIQKHAEVSNFLGFNDMIQKTKEEREAALDKYNYEKWGLEKDGIAFVYVAAFTLNNSFLGGMLWRDGKNIHNTHTNEDHNNLIKQF